MASRPAARAFACVLFFSLFLAPSRLPAADLIWKLKKPLDYPPGTVKHLIFYDAFLVSDNEGIYALSSICNLRGGPIFYPARDPRAEFVCRRCLTLYDIKGKPVVGACRFPMDWLRLELGEDGFLYLYPEYRGEFGKKILHPPGTRPFSPRPIPVPGMIPGMRPLH